MVNPVISYSLKIYFGIITNHEFEKGKAHSDLEIHAKSQFHFKIPMLLALPYTEILSANATRIAVHPR